MKKCKECKVIKPLSDYYENQAMSDGYWNKCKVCVRERVAKHRKENIKRIREYDRQREYLPNGERRSAKWHDENPERSAITKRNSQRVMRALKAGILSKSESCEECGTTEIRLEAAHYDYRRPLDVRWLCRPCHRKWDAAQAKTTDVDVEDVDRLRLRSGVQWGVFDARGYLTS